MKSIFVSGLYKKQQFFSLYKTKHNYISLMYRILTQAYHSERNFRHDVRRDKLRCELLNLEYSRDMPSRALLGR